MKTYIAEEFDEYFLVLYKGDKKPMRIAKSALNGEAQDEIRKHIPENMAKGGNVPTDKELWSRAKTEAKKKFDVYPSAYANAWAAKWYKEKGGGWRKMAEGGLTEWFAEEWVDIGRPKEGGGYEECGRPDADSGKYPKCVPAAKAASMSESEKRSAVSRKREAESDGRGGKPTNVPTFVKKADGGEAEEVIDGFTASERAKIAKESDTSISGSPPLGYYPRVPDEEVKTLEQKAKLDVDKYVVPVPEFVKKFMEDMKLKNKKATDEDVDPKLVTQAKRYYQHTEYLDRLRAEKQEAQKELEAIERMKAVRRERPGQVEEYETLPEGIDRGDPFMGLPPVKEIDIQKQKKKQILMAGGGEVFDQEAASPMLKEIYPNKIGTRPQLYMFADGGYVVTRSNERKGKTHKVTGPGGKVMFFGDPNLKNRPDNPDAKKSFYARHKKSLDKNPFFRAYARATWADGGEVEGYQEGGPVGDFAEGDPRNFIDMGGEMDSTGMVGEIPEPPISVPVEPAPLLPAPIDAESALLAEEMSPAPLDIGPSGEDLTELRKQTRVAEIEGKAVTDVSVPPLSEEQLASPVYQSLVKSFSKSLPEPQARLLAEDAYRLTLPKPTETAEVKAEVAADADPAAAKDPEKIDLYAAGLETYTKLYSSLVAAADKETDPVKKAEILQDAADAARMARIQQSRISGLEAGKEFDRDLDARVKEDKLLAELNRQEKAATAAFNAGEAARRQKALDATITRLTTLQTDSEKLLTELKDGRVDPNRVVANMGAFNFGIASTLGILGKALGAKGSVQDYIDTLVKQDVNAQVVDLNRKRTLLQDYIRAGNSLADAYKLTEANLKEIAAANLTELLGPIRDDIAAVQARQAAAKLRQDAIKAREDVVKRQIELELLPERLLAQLNRDDLAAERLQVMREAERGRDVRNRRQIGLGYGRLAETKRALDVREEVAEAASEQAVAEKVGTPTQQGFNSGIAVRASDIKSLSPEQRERIVDVPGRKGYITAAKTKEDATKIKKSQQALAEAKRTIVDLEAIRERNPNGFVVVGGVVVGGEQKAADYAAAITYREGLLSALTNALETGVIQQGDYKRLLAFIPNVTDFERQFPKKERFKSFEKELENKVNAQLDVGLVRPIDEQFDAAGRPTEPKGFKATEPTPRFQKQPPRGDAASAKKPLPPGASAPRKVIVR